ncbi:MAG: hypothetical protein MJ007_01850 [Paludibacteraceae bacterium]|nr:hypothetical protein [Paludibacteraceae bacterium]
MTFEVKATGAKYITNNESLIAMYEADDRFTKAKAVDVVESPQPKPVKRSTKK